MRLVSLHSHEYNISYIGNQENCWEVLRAIYAKAKSGMTGVNAKKYIDCAISSRASRTDEGSTTIESTGDGKLVEYTASAVEAPGCPKLGHKIWSILLVMEQQLWYICYSLNQIIKGYTMNRQELIKSRLEGKYTIDSDTDCWNWNGSLDSTGYAQMQIRSLGKNKKASRFSYIAYKGDIGDKLVCHTCDNPKCVNPEHLFLGTYKENSDDMMSKGRGCIGAKQGRSKLTEEDVLEMYKLHNIGLSGNKIAKRFGVCKMQAWRILNGHRWSHLFHLKDDLKTVIC